MRQHDPGIGRNQPQSADQSALEQRGTAGSSGGRLLVDIERGHVVDHEDAVGQPLSQQDRRFVVLLARAVRNRAGEDQPDHVVRVSRHQLVLVITEDHVVRWRGDIGEPAHPVLRIADAVKRRQLEATDWLVS